MVPMYEDRTGLSLRGSLTEQQDKSVVGTILGAMTAALIGQEIENGFVRGAAIGAISGAVFSIESSLLLWKSDESRIGCLLYLVSSICCTQIDVLASLLSGRLVHERIGPAMFSAVQSQMGAVETTFKEVQNIFDTVSAKGLPGDSVAKIPNIVVSIENVDASGDRVSCSVCLQGYPVEKLIGNALVQFPIFYCIGACNRMTVNGPEKQYTVFKVYPYETGTGGHLPAGKKIKHVAQH